jgi:hypothetical protein
MAVMVKLHVAGTRDQHDAVDAKVEETLATRGGPPPGMMFHLSWPGSDGFVVMDVWRTEDEARPFLDDVVLPAMTAVGIHAGEPAVIPVWGMAIPPGR